MTASATISRPLRKLLAAGPMIYRDGNTLMTGDACPADLLPELEALCLPRISEAEGEAVVALLKEHAGRVRYVVKREEAVDVVAELMAAEALAFDVETAPLPHYRAPVPLAFTKSGSCANDNRPRASPDWLSIRIVAASDWSRSSAGQTPASSSSISSGSAGARSRLYGRNP